MTRTPLKIGITCYSTFGGSGVIATEIGMEMARRGHRVHFICLDVPRRLDRFMENVYFHEVVLHDYPLFPYPPYALGLASKMVEVCTYEELDVLHVHYAVPHATSAYLTAKMLAEKAPRVITTLHGTDITLVGYERSYLPITRFSIIESDGVTAPSQYLRLATYDKLNVPSSMPIEVIPNFVDTDRFKPAARDELAKPQIAVRGKPCKPGEHTLVHVSNFRPVKRIQDVVRIFDIVNKQISSYLIFVGDGPERSPAETLVRDLGLSDRVCFLGKQESFVEVLQRADVFLLPSETESFGLAALEAQSCGVPVVASNVHGIPEVIVNGETGFLSDVGDVAEMAENALRILRDKALYRRMREAARDRAVRLFNRETMGDKYEEYYYKVLGR